MPLNIIRNDITKMQVCAIANPADPNLEMGGGACGAIFKAAGADKLQRACKKLAPIRAGEAVATKGFDLPAKYIIHTVGPVYNDGESGEEALLGLCYKNSLDLAKKKGCESIAFPLISSGAYGYPKDKALSVATSAISEWLATNDMDVSLVVFDKAAFALSNELLGDVRAFIDENYVDKSRIGFTGRLSRPWTRSEATDIDAVVRAALPSMEPHKSAEAFRRFDTADLSKLPKQKKRIVAPSDTSKPPAISTETKKLDDIITQLDEPFSKTLLRLIDAKGKTDVEIYKRANLDRKLFSKIRTGKGYMPGKKTVIALAVALELSLPETRDLLERAGFALSRSVMFDVIIEYFISRKRYDIFEINNVLFEYDQQLLGG
jgi:O-acetyl-ADP-ribose deacetylase (regulator of RNase III)